MHILVVDDEELALAELTHELKIVFPNAALHGYRNPKEAIEYAAVLSAEGEVFSYAFLDIKMRSMSGLELARQLKIIFPKVNLFFCTAYSEYAIDAFGMFAKGYLKKPVAASEIKRVLDEMVTDWSLEKTEEPCDIRVQTFGHFEVFADGKPVIFEREKSKESIEFLPESDDLSQGGTMMEKILFINACVRERSRTLSLAQYILDKLNGEICEINLEQENLKPLDGNVLEKREHLVSEHNFSDGMFHYAKEFAAADTIVIAAPYWDLAFPALLKIYLEQITVCGITFRYKKGIPQGLCRAKRLIYVTTAGGTIYDNFGFEYVKALAQKLYGIGEVLFFKAENLDIDGNDVNDILRMAKSDAEKTLRGDAGI